MRVGLGQRRRDPRAAARRAPSAPRRSRRRRARRRAAAARGSARHAAGAAAAQPERAHELEPGPAREARDRGRRRTRSRAQERAAPRRDPATRRTSRATPRARSASATASAGSDVPDRSAGRDQAPKLSALPPSPRAMLRRMPTDGERYHQARAAVGDERERDSGQRREPDHGREVDRRLPADERGDARREPLAERVLAARCASRRPA